MIADNFDSRVAFVFDTVLTNGSRHFRFSCSFFFFFCSNLIYAIHSNQNSKTQNS